MRVQWTRLTGGLCFLAVASWCGGAPARGQDVEVNCSGDLVPLTLPVAPACEEDKDDDPDKRKARFMLRMTDNLNGYVLPLVPERDQPNVRLECKTCHRGQARPVLLTQELEFVIDEHGVDSAAARYRELRQDYGMSGAFDFGEWEMNTLGERLNANGRFRDAIGIYELNAEYHPQSASITFSLGNLYVEVADTAAAIRYFERTLELQPRFRRAKDRLDQLRGN